MQTHRIATLVPLMVGAGAVVCTVVIYALPLSATVNFVRREKNLVAWVRVSGLIWELLRGPYCARFVAPSWRLLGPLETANGMLMFGVSTAMIFAVIQRLVEARFVDLKE